MTALNYQVRVSSRAKHPRLKMSARDGLVVIIPDAFDTSRIPAVLAAKREWITRSEERLRDRLAMHRPAEADAPPVSILLRALNEKWTVTYRQTRARSVTAVDRPDQRILVYGNLTKTEHVEIALRRWLARKTRERIVPWLSGLATELRLEMPHVTIRAQRKRWASCSAKGTISLNVRLLFLPHDLVRYALLHELAHLQEMNHSRRYWALLGSFEPNYLALEGTLRASWGLVPGWFRPDL